MIRGWPIALGLVVSVSVFLALAAARPTSAAAATPTDVMFLFDTSGSMAEVLGEASAEMQQVMTHIESVVPEVDYGVAEVRDYGESLYDEEGDLPWRLVTPITPDRAAVTTAISQLLSSGGGDGPEAYGRALWETDTNPTVGWRPGARHAIILIADNVPHMPDVNLGLSEALWLELSPWETGEELPGAWDIPGTQLPPGQKTEFLEVLPRLVGDGKPLEMVDYHETDAPNYVHYWEYWASLAGGLALEAGSGSKELAGKLIGLIERAAPPCASAVTPTAASPQPPSTLPSALTARFGAPGTRVTIVPAAGFRFCAGQRPYLGGVEVTSLEESTPSQISFQVPPTAAGGLAISGTNGAVGPPSSFEVDNFRFPWGMAIRNYPGSGSGGTYDDHITITGEDLRSVFSGLGPEGSPEYKVAAAAARWALANGLCYGMSLLGKSLYGDSHGRHYRLGWASSKGFALHATTTPYSLRESRSGAHALTHALLRAAISQFSPQAQASMKQPRSAAALKHDLDAAFRAGQPALLSIHFNREGHALMAFNYQSPDPSTGQGIAVDVADPNAPWAPGSPPSDYEHLQIHVRTHGGWTFSGTFPDRFADDVSSGSGTLFVQSDPPMPGGLNLVSGSGGGDVVLRPGNGDAVSAVSYSKAPSHGIPDDVEPERVFADAKPLGLVIPAGHHTFTATIKAKTGKKAGALIIGPGFIDSANVPGHKGTISVSTDSGAIGAPSVPAGTTLSATTVTGEVQQTATVTFSGRVRRPQVTVGRNGGVTVTAAGGSGRASIKLGAFAPGHKARVPKETVRIHGRTKLTRHAPRVKHRKPHHHAKACKGGATAKRHRCGKR